MSARAQSAGALPQCRTTNRLAPAFVLVVLGVATLVFWIGIPIGGLWLLSKLTDSWNGHFLLSLVSIPTAMALFSPALLWLNWLYLRTTGALGGEEDAEVQRRRLAGPLELFLTAGMVIAVIALIAWFFFLAKYPPEVVW
ncbi:MAG: hypothetical protein ACRDLL_12885 [Solirubrobacterales bacterium]